MTLPLTKTVLRACYDFLNETQPFRKWNLPDGEDVSFRVVRDRSSYAWLETKRRRVPTIAVSSENIGHTFSLLEAMAHEMGHMHQYRTGMPLTHGAEWQKIKAEICRYHGFDPKKFG